MMKKFFYTVALCAAFTTTSSFASLAGEIYLEQHMSAEEAVVLQAHQYAYIQNLAWEKWHMTDVLTKFKGATTPETQARVDDRIALINQSNSLSEATTLFCHILSPVMGDLEKLITRSAGYDAGPLPEGEIPEGIDTDALTSHLSSYDKTLRLFKSVSHATPFMSFLCDGAARRTLNNAVEARFMKEDADSSRTCILKALEDDTISDMEVTVVSIGKLVNNVSPILGNYFDGGYYLAPSFLARTYGEYLLFLDATLQETKRELSRMMTAHSAPSFAS